LVRVYADGLATCNDPETVVACPIELDALVIEHEIIGVKNLFKLITCAARKLFEAN
jgi:hypothetical protein